MANVAGVAGDADPADDAPDPGDAVTGSARHTERCLPNAAGVRDARHFRPRAGGGPARNQRLRDRLLRGAAAGSEEPGADEEGLDRRRRGSSRVAQKTKSSIPPLTFKPTPVM